MILTLDNHLSLADVKKLIDRLEWMGLRVVRDTDSQGNVILVVVQGTDKQTRLEAFSQLPGVVEVKHFDTPYKLAGTHVHQHKTVIQCKDHKIGGKKIVVMSGSCSVESERQIMETAKQVSAKGATILRGGAFKPRTSPYDFQGLGEIGLKYLQKAAEANHMLSVSEVMDPADIDMVAEHIDILQIGARNMQNYSLLKQLGKVKNPVLLKRGLAATYKEFLLAAEYILNAGNPNVMLCERGIRTFETYTRNTLDIAAVPILQELSHLPVIVDPSHGVGIRRMVAPMCYAAVAAGADGLLIEAHPDPDNAMSDAQQTVSPETLGEIMQHLAPIAQAVGRSMV